VPRQLRRHPGPSLLHASGSPRRDDRQPSADTHEVTCSAAAGIVSDTSTGRLLENFVLSELARHLTWSMTSARLYHYRDRDQYEVDGILENAAGEIIGVEVKAAETVRAEDLRGLELLRRKLGKRFRAGFVLYCGSESLSFGDRLAYSQFPRSGPPAERIRRRRTR